MEFKMWIFYTSSAYITNDDDCFISGKIGSIWYSSHTLIKIPNEKIVDVSAHYFQCFLLTDNGKVYGFGNNVHGVLGMNIGSDECVISPTLLNINNEKITKVQCRINLTIFYTQSNNVYYCGNNEILNSHLPTLLFMNTIEVCITDKHIYNLTIHGELRLQNKIIDNNITEIHGGRNFYLLCSNVQYILHTR